MNTILFGFDFSPNLYIEKEIRKNTKEIDYVLKCGMFKLSYINSQRKWSNFFRIDQNLSLNTMFTNVKTTIKQNLYSNDKLKQIKGNVLHLLKNDDPMLFESNGKWIQKHSPITYKGNNCWKYKYFLQTKELTNLIDNSLGEIIINKIFNNVNLRDMFDSIISLNKTYIEYTNKFKLKALKDIQNG